LYHLVNDGKISKYNLVTILNEVFQKKLIINPYDGYKVDKSLINTRSDFDFKVNSYEVMISEMKNWIQSNKELYPNYISILNSK